MPTEAPKSDLVTGPASTSSTASAADFVNLPDTEFAKVLGLKDPSTASALEESTSEEPAQAVTPETALPAQSATEPTPQSAVAQPEQVSPLEVAPVATPVAEPEPVKLLTSFDLYDAEGPLDVEDASKKLKFKFKAVGKEYADIPLDKVVLLAQMGFANEQREQQVLGAKKFVAEKEAENTELRSMVQQYETRTKRILEDYTEYEAARERYAQSNSPEARAQRAEQRADDIEQSNAEAQTNAVRQQYIAQHLYPTLRNIVDSSNGVISEQEVLGQFSLLSAPLMVRGVLPVERFQQTQHLVETELRDWAKGQTVLRETEKQRATAAEQAKTVKATNDAALAKRQLARTVAPSQPSAVPTPSKPKPKVYTSAADWMDDLGGLTSIEPSS